jgi:class 3 adenylate cyclase/tetratricopeptide (TPR) repeat protein
MQVPVDSRVVDTVACPGCGEENPAKFRLCGFCGTALHPVPETVTCPSCGEENPGKFRLCGFCGTPLATPAAAAPPPPPIAAQPVAAPAPAPAAPLPPSEVRKVVTLVFSDLKDSTALTASIDAEAMNEIKARYFSSMAAEIERHGGSVEKNIGDAIMAVFGRIRAREDDALRAVRAAHGMHDALERLNQQLLEVYGVTLKNRTGVNTGELVVNTDPTASQNLATGEAVNVAARLEQNAPANETLIGEVTYELVRPWVDVERMELQLKGYAEPVPAFRLITVHDHAAERSEVAETPLVGRDVEFGRLRAAMDEAKQDRGPRLMTVIGDAGVGKTRLIRDFLTSIHGEATILRGRCLPYGDGITFWPLGEIARAAADIEQDDSPADALAKLGERIGSQGDGPAITERLGSAIGLSSTRFPVADLLWAGRRFLEVLAADRPVAVLIDDIHWAEKTFLDFLDHVIDASKRAPILLLCSARHQLLERFAEWGDREHMGRIMLEPLGDAFAAELVERLLGESGIDPAVSDRVVKAADGNPLFVEQMVSMLIDKKLLQREGGHWVRAGDLSDLAVPPSIQALLVSRLDDLTREERVVVEPASVIGLTFFEPAVTEMVPEAIRSTVHEHLDELDTKQFVQPGGDEETFKFRHILIRDATYGSLLKRNRAQLHERFVTWAERVNRERGREQEFEEILGYHLEQAYRYRTELGPIDAAGRSIAERAATKLASAGRRGYARGDLPAATSLLRRAVNLLQADSTERVELLCDLADCLQDAGSFGEADAAVDEARRIATNLGDERLHALVDVVGGFGQMYGTDAEANAGAIGDAMVGPAEVLARAGDYAGEAKAWHLVTLARGTAGQWEEVAATSAKTIAAARRAGDRLLVSRGALAYAQGTFYGETPVDEALERITELEPDVAGDRHHEAFIRILRGLVLALLGRFDEARRLGAEGRAMLLELGPSVAASSTSMELARIELAAGDPAAAAAMLEQDLGELEVLEERYFRSTIAGLLAQARFDLGDIDGAETAANLTAALADPDDIESLVMWRSALGNVRASQGRAAEALEHAKGAVESSDQTINPVLQAQARMSLGRTLIILGQSDEAGPPLREALMRAQAKGAVGLADRIGRILDGTGRATSTSASDR